MLTLLLVTLAPLAGIVAKGLGVIAIIFGVGAVFGVVVTLWVTSRVRSIRKR